MKYLLCFVSFLFLFSSSILAAELNFIYTGFIDSLEVILPGENNSFEIQIGDMISFTDFCNNYDDLFKDNPLGECHRLERNSEFLFFGIIKSIEVVSYGYKFEVDVLGTPTTSWLLLPGQFTDFNYIQTHYPESTGHLSSE